MFSLLLSRGYPKSSTFQFLVLSHHCRCWWCTRSWKVTAHLTPTDQRDIPYHMELWSAYKLRGKLPGGPLPGSKLNITLLVVNAFHLQRMFFLGLNSLLFCCLPFHDYCCYYYYNHFNY